MTSAFIIDINQQLQPDPGEETIALLRVLIHKIDNTTFGGSIPTVPEWTGPPRTIVQVQSILFSSLTTSLFSAFLAMLGKQWLNRYASVDVRGSAIERSQQRQRKLNGIASWYFEHVMESLPIMLQFSLLLLGCALSQYLWTVDMTVASVVLGVTSFGVLTYILIVIMGTFNDSCPYRTPGSQSIRYLWRKSQILRDLLYTTYSNFRRIHVSSDFIALLGRERRWASEPWWSKDNLWWCLTHVTPRLPVALASDIFSVIRTPFVFGVVCIYKTHRRLFMESENPEPLLRNGTSLDITNTFEQQIHISDSYCISWMLGTSLDRDFDLIALELLMETSTFPTSDPTILLNCFNVLAGCVTITGTRAAVSRGSERLAEMAIACFLTLLSHFLVIVPGSSVLEEVCQQYKKTFAPTTSFGDLQSSSTMTVIHHLFYTGAQGRRAVCWDDFHPSIPEHGSVMRCLLLIAWSEYRKRREWRKVPRWILRFALRSLSQETLPPDDIIADSLLIIGIDLGYTISEADALASDKGYVLPLPRIQGTCLMFSFSSTRIQLRRITNSIASRLTKVAQDPGAVLSKYKVITALFPYAVRRGQEADSQLLDAFLCAVKYFPHSSQWTLRYIRPMVPKLLMEGSSILLKRAAILALPYLELAWLDSDDISGFGELWISAADSVEDTEDVSQAMVDVLLQMAFFHSVRAHITPKAWSWLNKRPLLPPRCRGRLLCSIGSNVLPAIRARNDIKLLTSYLITMWSEWDCAGEWAFDGMCEVLSEEFCGDSDGVREHRKDLVVRLDSVLMELGGGLEYLRMRHPDMQPDELEVIRERYRELKRILVQGTVPNGAARVNRTISDLPEPSYTMYAR